MPASRRIRPRRPVFSCSIREAASEGSRSADDQASSACRCRATSTAAPQTSISTPWVNRGWKNAISRPSRGASPTVSTPMLQPGDDRASHVRNLEREMVKPFAVLLEVASHGGVVGQGFQELDLAAGEGQQGHFDPLALDLLDAFDLESQHLFVEDAGVDDRADGDTYVGESHGHRGAPSAEESSGRKQLATPVDTPKWRPLV